MARKPSSVQAFLASVEGTCLIVAVLNSTLRSFNRSRRGTIDDPEQLHLFMQVSEMHMRASKTAADLLKADVQVQRDFQDLKARLEAGMTNDEIERTLEAHFERRGWGSLEFVRTSLFTYLTESGLKREQAEEIVAATVPHRGTHPQRTPLAYKLRKAHERMEEGLEVAATELSECLSGDGEGTEDGTKDEGTGSDSDPQGGPDEAE